MFRTLTIAGLLAATVAAPVSAQTFFHFGAGTYQGPIYAAPPVYAEPPIVYEAPFYGQPPVVYYEAPPAYGAPSGIREVAPGVLHMEAPEDVAAQLAAAGFRDIAPIDRQGAIYHTQAVDPGGDLVALQISIFTGQIERADVLEARYEPAPPPIIQTAPEPYIAPAPRPYTPPTPSRSEEPVVEAAAPSPPPPVSTGTAATTSTSSAAPSTLRDRLAPPNEDAASDEPEEGERDPLVVY